MKKYIMCMWCALSVMSVYSQIGINTETLHNSAMLDIESTTGGVILPRLSTLQKESINNPAVGLIVYDTDKRCVSENVGTESAPVWICLTQDATRFFYMPSITIETPAVGAVSEPLDLYQEYVKQFATPMWKSTGAMNQIPYYSSAADLNYYITYYDRSVLNITNISDDGKVTYSIVRKSDYDTYMNVVFVVK